ncbi:MAG: NAD(P)H-dependent oxidoreductase [Roseiarcus sp.]|jgi:putative NADPH-quinone reductase
MRVLVVFAHPSETSFVAALHQQIVATLRARGHAVDDLDLYAERFDPVMPRRAFHDYTDTANNREGIVRYVERLRAAEALALVFPVWQDGFPAILKGFFDCVFVPGVSFRIDENGLFLPMLSSIRRIAAVGLYGGGRRRASLMGDPTRRFVARNLAALAAPDARCEYLACYDMNDSTPESRARFMAKVKRAFEGWRDS